jgi:ankyrin repeat protein
MAKDKQTFRIAVKMIEDGDIADLRDLLQDIDISTTESRKRTLVHMAAKADNAQAIRLLLDLGADIAAEDYRRNTPLHLACDAAAVRASQLLLSTSAPIDARNSMDFLPIHAAARGLRDFGQRVEIVVMLLDAGSDINAETNAGRTPLFFAATCGNASLVDLLLTRGANPDLVPPNEPDLRTAAGENGFPDVVEVFDRFMAR